MKIKFKEMFLIAAWIMFLVSDRTVTSSIILMAAGLYELSCIIPKLMEVYRNAGRKS